MTHDTAANESTGISNQPYKHSQRKMADRRTVLARAQPFAKVFVFCIGATLATVLPAQAQTFEETALFLISMGYMERLPDPATGIVRDNLIERARATFDPTTCTATFELEEKQLNIRSVTTINFGRVNTTSFVRKPYVRRAISNYDSDMHGISFTMASADGMPICERVIKHNGEVIVPAPGRTPQCDTIAEFRTPHEKAPRMEAAIHHLFSQHCTGVKRAF